MICGRNLTVVGGGWLWVCGDGGWWVVGVAASDIQIRETEREREKSIKK